MGWKDSQNTNAKKLPDNGFHAFTSFGVGVCAFLLGWEAFVLSTLDCFSSICSLCTDSARAPAYGGSDLTLVFRDGKTPRIPTPKNYRIVGFMRSLVLV